MHEPLHLETHVEYSSGSIVSKTLFDKKSGSLTLFAFDAGQKLSEHTSPYDAIVQVLDGEACLSIGAQQVKLSSGQFVVMPAAVPHSVQANVRFKMLLTMIK